MAAENPNPNLPERRGGAAWDIFFGVSSTISAFGLLALPEPFLKGIAVAAIVSGCGFIVNGFNKLGYNRAIKETSELQGLPLPPIRGQRPTRRQH